MTVLVGYKFWEIIRTHGLPRNTYDNCANFIAVFFWSAKFKSPILLAVRRTKHWGDGFESLTQLSGTQLSGENIH